MGVQEAITKASALIEAMEYIRRFAGRTVVVKLGGSVLNDPALQKKLLTDIAFMATVGIRPVIVHGGGKAITQAMNQAGLQPQWVHGQRYTDQPTLAIVEHTLVKKVNQPLCDTLTDLGCDAMGLHSLSSCVLTAELLRPTGQDGRKIDLGLVGTVTSVNAHLINTLCVAGTIPVIAPIARDKTGGKLNVNADTVTGRVAAALKADKLVVVSDTHGIKADPKDPSSLLSTANEEQIKDMIQKAVITEGMLPKVAACLEALDGGVQKAHIIDGRIPHSLLLEIYTDKGIGTQIVQ